MKKVNTWQDPDEQIWNSLVKKCGSMKAFMSLDLITQSDEKKAAIEGINGVKQAYFYEARTERMGKIINIVWSFTLGILGS